VILGAHGIVVDVQWGSGSYRTDCRSIESSTAYPHCRIVFRRPVQYMAVLAEGFASQCARHPPCARIVKSISHDGSASRPSLSGRVALGMEEKRCRACRGSHQAGSDTPAPSQDAPSQDVPSQDVAKLCNCEYPLPPMFTVLAAVLLAAAGILAVVTAERRRSLYRFDVGPLSQGWVAARRSEDASQH